MWVVPSPMIYDAQWAKQLRHSRHTGEEPFLGVNLNNSSQ
jgi:hypothetical protein